MELVKIDIIRKRIRFDFSSIFMEMENNVISISHKVFGQYGERFMDGFDDKLTEQEVIELLVNILTKTDATFREKMFGSRMLCEQQFGTEYWGVKVKILPENC